SAHIRDGGAGQVRLRSQRIKQMVREDLVGRGDRGEVVGAVPAQQLRGQAQQLILLRGGQFDAECRRAGGEPLLCVGHGLLRTKPATYCCTGIASRLSGWARSFSHSAAMRRAWPGVNSFSPAACSAVTAASSDSAAGVAMSRVQCWYRLASVGGAWPASTA